MSTIECALFLVDEAQIEEVSEGVMKIPPPRKIMNVVLDKEWLDKAMMVQRRCEMEGEPFIVRMFEDDNSEKNPVFASAVVSLPAFFTGFGTTGGNN